MPETSYLLNLEGLIGSSDAERKGVPKVVNDFEAYQTFCQSSSYHSAPTVTIDSSISSTCSICQFKQKDSVLIPCGHKFGCYACSVVFKQCPHCDAPVKQCLRLINCESPTPPGSAVSTPQCKTPHFCPDRCNTESSSLIKDYGKQGDLASCWQVWTKLCDTVVPNEITLGCMVDALVTNRQVSQAEGLVRLWKAKVQPNTVVYSTLIHGWAKQNDAKRAMAIFAQMRQEGVTCNAVTYNCMIHACVRVSDMDAALGLLEDMKSANSSLIKPDKFTYSTIIKGYCCKGDMDQALLLFQSMLDEDIAPDLVIYNTLLDGCVKRKHHDICDTLLADMSGYWKITPNSYTLSILIKHHGRQGDLFRAFQLVDELPRNFNFSANAHVWTCLISACMNQGRFGAAEAVFSAMCGDSLPLLEEEDLRLVDAISGHLKDICSPDMKTFETFIQGCLRYAKIDMALRLCIQCSSKRHDSCLPRTLIDQVIQAAILHGLDASPIMQR